MNPQRAQPARWQRVARFIARLHLHAFQRRAVGDEFDHVIDRRCRVGFDGQHLPVDTDSCDGALSTFTLCTIPDVVSALAEVARVLKPGAPFHVLEHGLAPDDGVARWQRRLDPIQHRVADGCHLTRDPIALLEGAGFEVVEHTSRYARGPKPFTYFTTAKALAPG